METEVQSQLISLQKVEHDILRWSEEIKAIDSSTRTKIVNSFSLGIKDQKHK